MATGLAGSARWTLAAMVARQGGRLGLSLLLARWLGPAEFGVIAAVSIYIAFVGFFLEAGFSAGIVQKEDLRPQDVGATFWIASGSGVLIALMTLLLASDLADLLAVSAVQGPLLILALSPLFKSLTVAPVGLLTRAMRLRYIAAAEIVATLVSVIAGLVAAVLGLGYWSVVVQQLSADVLMWAIATFAAPRFSFAVDKEAMRRVRGYSGPIILSQMLGYLTLNIDNVLVSRYLGMEALAFYSIAYRVMQLPVTLVGSAVVRVTFPLVSRLQDHTARVQDIFVRSSRIISMIVCPLMLTLCGLSTLIIEFVFGRDWAPAAPVLQVFCVCAIMQAVSTPTGSILMGAGRSWLVLKWAAIPVPLALVGFVAGLPWGILGVAIGYTASVFMFAALLVRATSSIIDLGMRRWVVAVGRPALAAIPGASLMFAVQGYFGMSASLLNIIALAMMSIMTYLLAVWLVDRTGVRELSRLAGLTSNR